MSKKFSLLPECPPALSQSKRAAKTSSELCSQKVYTEAYKSFRKILKKALKSDQFAIALKAQEHIVHFVEKYVSLNASELHTPSKLSDYSTDQLLALLQELEEKHSEEKRSSETNNL